MKEDRKPTKKGRNNKDINDFIKEFFHTGSFDFFHDFEEQFRRMQQQMNQLSNQSYNEYQHEKNPNTRIYGYSYHIGPDGQPHFQEFGNTPSMLSNPPKDQVQSIEREQLIDIQESDKEIYVTTELPGVEKKDIHLESIDEILKIQVNDGKHPFYKEIKLPSKINDKKTDATYNNGVLSITLKKLKPSKKGKRIDIN